MARRPFNRSIDIWTGPGAPVPSTFVGTYDARLVRETEISQVGEGSPPVHHYLTIDAYQPTGAWTVPVLGIDRSLSDRVASTSGDDPDYWVLFTDHIVPTDGDPYWRSYLVALPKWDAVSELEYVYEITSTYVRHFYRASNIEYVYELQCDWSFVAGGYKVFDSFSYANDTNLDGHDVEGGTEAPQAWVRDNLDWKTVSAVAVADGYCFDDTKIGVLFVQSNVADCSIRVQCRQFLFPENVIMGVVFRRDDFENFWALICNSSDSTFYLRKYSGGGFSDETSAAAAITQSSIAWSFIEIILAGDDITVKLDGTTVLTWNDSFCNDKTLHGILQLRDNALWDGVAYFDFFGVL